MDYFAFLTGSGQGSNTRSSVTGPIIGGPFTLLDTQNRIVTEKNLLGNWVLLYFGYTSSPDVGPEQVRTMAKAIDVLGLSFYSFFIHEIKLTLLQIFLLRSCLLVC